MSFEVKDTSMASTHMGDGNIMTIVALIIFLHAPKKLNPDTDRVSPSSSESGYYPRTQINETGLMSTVECKLPLLSRGNLLYGKCRTSINCVNDST